MNYHHYCFREFKRQTDQEGLTRMEEERRAARKRERREVQAKRRQALLFSSTVDYEQFWLKGQGKKVEEEQIEGMDR